MELLKKIWDKLKWIIGFAVGGFLTFAIAKKTGVIGTVRREKRWKSFPGREDKIFVKDNQNKWKQVDIPVNPHTQKKYKKEEINKVGISSVIDKEIKFEIKHKGTDRHSKHNTTASNSGRPL